jgi:hypothetical protein
MAMVCGIFYVITNVYVTATNQVTQICVVIMPRKFVRILFFYVHVTVHRNKILCNKTN